MQLHAVITVEPVSPSVLADAGQLVHAAEPVVPLYVLIAHCEQDPPSGPVYPMLHLHAAAAVEPVAPSVLEDAGQLVHVAEPVVLL